jgi:hypothetical protein
MLVLIDGDCQTAVAIDSCKPHHSHEGERLNTDFAIQPFSNHQHKLFWFFDLQVALAFEFAHGGLDEVLGAVDLVEDGLEIKRGLGGIAVGDAIDAVLADEDDGVGEHVERDGEAASLRAKHELVFF